MEREGHNKVAMFIGTELENSKMKGARTLFVVGQEPINEISDRAKEHSVNHIYLCANKSFSPGLMGYYYNTALELINSGFYVTLDFPCYYFAMVHSAFETLLDNDYFIPMVNVELPKLESMKNFAMRLDDIDFNKTNSGVWVINRDTIAGTDCYTPWSLYSTDIVVKHKAAN